MQVSHVQRLWSLLVTEKKEIVPIYFYAFLNGLVQLAIPLGIQAIVGFVMGASMVTSIYVLIVVIVMAVLVVGIMQIKQMQIIEKIQQKIFTRYTFAFAETIPRTDLLSQGAASLPEKVNRFFDTIGIQKGISKLLLDIPTASIQIVFGLLLLAIYHPLFIVFGLLLLFILWIILKLTGKNGLRTSIKESTYKYAVVSWLEEMALNIKSFKFTQGTHLNLQKTDSKLLGYLSSRTKHFNVLLFQYWTLVVFKVMITAGMLGVGTYLLIQQQLNIGEFIAAEIVILTVITAVEKLIINLDSVYDVITGLEKLSLVLETPLEKNGNKAFVSGDSGMEVELIDFGFNYPDQRNLFENANVIIPANTITSISGHSGSGKSTFLKILGGFYMKHQGSLLYDHYPSGQYNLENLRQNISIYLQRDELYKGTIIENIALGRTSVTHDKVTHIIKELGLDDYFKSFKDNLETEVYPSGNNISDSLKRIILILRALVNEPRLLLMDEPLLGMDDKIKNSILRYLHKLKQHSTIFIVSNDRTFDKTCDYHLEIKNRNLIMTKNQ